MGAAPTVRWNETAGRWMAWARFPDGTRRKVERVEKADAKRDLDELVALRAQSLDPGPRRIKMATFSEVIGEWFRAGCPNVAPTSNSRHARVKSPNTIANARQLLGTRVLPVIGKLWVERQRAGSRRLMPDERRRPLRLRSAGIQLRRRQLGATGTLPRTARKETRLQPGTVAAWTDQKGVRVPEVVEHRCRRRRPHAGERRQCHADGRHELDAERQIWRSTGQAQGSVGYPHRCQACSSAAELLAGDAATDVEQMVLGVVQCVSDDGGRVDHLTFGVESDHDLFLRCE
jgi:hypothetical protein